MEEFIFMPSFFSMIFEEFKTFDLHGQYVYEMNAEIHSRFKKDLKYYKVY